MNHREPITIPNGDFSGFTARMLVSQLRLWKDQLRKHPRGTDARIRAESVYHQYAQELQSRIWDSAKLKEVK